MKNEIQNSMLPVADFMMVRIKATSNEVYFLQQKKTVNSELVIFKMEFNINDLMRINNY
jgi:hypothetical protein